MEKTGESYTAARRHVIGVEPDEHTTAEDAQSTKSQADQPAEPAPTPTDQIKPLQHSDASVLERTGRSWDEWFAMLDAWDATSRNHTEIARWLVEEQKVHGWWAQSIAVTYEQARGMRIPGQGPDGFFTASASKTIAVPALKAFEAFADDALRERWLPGAMLTVTTKTPPKSFRATWDEDGTRLVVGFTPKGEAKVQVGVAHEKVPDAERAGQLKAFWRDRLPALKTLLESPDSNAR
jgi:hypothetical protein